MTTPTARPVGRRPITGVRSATKRRPPPLLRCTPQTVRSDRPRSRVTNAKATRPRAGGRRIARPGRGESTPGSAGQRRRRRRAVNQKCEGDDETLTDLSTTRAVMLQK